MAIYRDSVKKVYSKLEDTIILGLTGRTGSGCSTVADILKTDDFGKLSLPKPKYCEFVNLEERKYSIVHNYMRNNWDPFITIGVSGIIISFIIEQPFKSFENFIKDLPQKDRQCEFRINGVDDFLKRLKGVECLFGNDEILNIDEDIKSVLNDKILVEKYFKFYTETVNEYKRIFYEISKDYSCYENTRSYFENSKEKKYHLYTYLMQLIGNNIRCSGDPYNFEFNGTHFHSLATRVCNVIEIIKRHNKNLNRKTRICIDALRNPYEVFYLKDIYSNFYLLSVSTEDEERKRRLKHLDENELLSMDEMEYPAKDIDKGEIFYRQSIADCLQISDIHLYNEYVSDKKYKLLTKKLVRYISLMLHPGLVTPTDEERCMQVAYNTRFNSGCLSRQVGAVITDENYCIKAIGWNDAPCGQVPCSLRNIPNHISEVDKNTFSEFELNDPTFCRILTNLNKEYHNETDMSGWNLSFCFKDIYNGIKDDKNQVHTRALHAEENAFLQISKYGGQGIKGGKLFVTASPCELCSKKSYQLGIKEIYYIDPYPGISSSQVLKSGALENKPVLKLFYGAIGNAYIRLYTQRFSYKDELQLVSGVNVKKVAKNKKNKQEELQYDDVLHKSTYLELHFKNRHEIEFEQKVEVLFQRDGITELRKNLSWSGSSYDKTIIVDGDANYQISNECFSDGSCQYTISKKDGEFHSGEEFKYNVKTCVRDELENMNPVLYHHVKTLTDSLKMKIKFDKKTYDDIGISNVRVVVYADVNKNIIYDIVNLNPTVDDEEYLEYERTFEKPNLLYVYSLEWDF